MNTAAFWTQSIEQTRAALSGDSAMLASTLAAMQAAHSN
jgi:hypothetical protein